VLSLNDNEQVLLNLWLINFIAKIESSLCYKNQFTFSCKNRHHRCTESAVSCFFHILDDITQRKVKDNFSVNHWFNYFHVLMSTNYAKKIMPILQIIVEINGTRCLLFSTLHIYVMVYQYQVRMDSTFSNIQFSNFIALDEYYLC
jgi:hypothetical protein